MHSVQRPPPVLADAAGAAPLVSRSRDQALARQAVMRRLLALDEDSGLETVHVRIVAGAAGVSVRTVWHWLAAARESGRVEPVPRRSAFTVTDEWSAGARHLGPVRPPHRTSMCSQSTNDVRHGPCEVGVSMDFAEWIPELRG
ncbi:hypothetical protein ABT009_41730 [Streptomyces sp. NPDC002896]|uniref:hypothetical protein n=1 Tax=Streptomyces sp. NPDC002896 TaxID=3154438 RepID=UPI0033290944